MNAWPPALVRFSLLAAALLSACANPPPAPQAAPGPPPGETKRTAIEVCMPAGERAYLSRLQCANGEPVRFRRVGNFGPRTEIPANMPESESSALLEKMLRREAPKPGEPDFHIVDGYEVTCGASKRLIYLDMYHCQQPPPEVAPGGYVLKPAT